MMRKAFTLLEVNLAIGVMAAGVLTVVVLYTLGFRESRQSREDLASAAYADAVLSPIVNAASATNLAWSAFNQLEDLPDEDGWATYMNQSTGLVSVDPTARARSVYSKVMQALKAQGTKELPTDASPGMLPGLVVKRDKDSTLLKIAFRASIKKETLLAAPIYYTEVRFQGDPDR